MVQLTLALQIRQNNAIDATIVALNGLVFSTMLMICKKPIAEITKKSFEAEVNRLYASATGLERDDIATRLTLAVKAQIIELKSLTHK